MTKNRVLPLLLSKYENFMKNTHDELTAIVDDLADQKWALKLLNDAVQKEVLSHVPAVLKNDLSAYLTISLATYYRNEKNLSFTITQLRAITSFISSNM